MRAATVGVVAFVFACESLKVQPVDTPAPEGGSQSNPAPPASPPPASPPPASPPPASPPPASPPPAVPPPAAPPRSGWRQENPSPAAFALRGAWAASPNDVWAFGSDYYSDLSSGNYLAHWNGTSWAAIATPKLADPARYYWLQDFTAIAPNDVWAVGGIYDPLHAKFTDNVTLHWDGAWHRVAAPSIGSSPSLSHIGGTPGNLWAVGGYWDTNTNSAKTLVLHGTGAAWSLTTRKILRAAVGGVPTVSEDARS